MSGQAKMDRSTQAEREQIHPSCNFLFCLSPQELGWCPPTLGQTPALLCSLIQMLISSGNTGTDPPRNTFTHNLASLRPITLTCKLSFLLVLLVLLVLLTQFFFKVPSFQTSESVCGKGELFLYFPLSDRSQGNFFLCYKIYKEFIKLFFQFLCST